MPTDHAPVIRPLSEEERVVIGRDLVYGRAAGWTLAGTVAIVGGGAAVGSSALGVAAFLGFFGLVGAMICRGLWRRARRDLEAGTAAAFRAVVTEMRFDPNAEGASRLARLEPGAPLGWADLDHDPDLHARLKPGDLLEIARTPATGRVVSVWQVVS